MPLHYHQGRQFRVEGFHAVSGVALLVFILLLALLGSHAWGQSGSFVIPSFRGTADFAYWDKFNRPPGSPTNTNYNYANPPALLDGQGMDDEGHATTAFAARAHLKQVGTTSCFITSSFAIYSFNGTAAYEIPYTPPTSPTGEVTNVVFQVQGSSGAVAAGSMLLTYVSGGQTLSVAPLYRALDDPQTGNFGERLMFGYQWNLTGLGVRDFKIIFTAAGSSAPLWQAQLDAVAGAPFQQELGYLLSTHSRPLTRYGKPGMVDKNLPQGVDGRYFYAGDQLSLLGLPELDWEHVGWLYNGSVYTAGALNLVFPAADTSVTALFAPLTYAAWRELTFYHANSLTGTSDDYSNAAVSGPSVDHDKDGVSNFGEFAFGGDPYTPDSSRTQPELLTVNVAGVDYPAIRYRTSGAPPEFSELEYIVAQSTNLTTWVDNRSSPTTQELSRVTQADGSALVTERSLTPMASLARCYLRVLAQPYTP